MMENVLYVLLRADDLSYNLRHTLVDFMIIAPALIAGQGRVTTFW